MSKATKLKALESPLNYYEKIFKATKLKALESLLNY